MSTEQDKTAAAKDAGAPAASEREQGVLAHDDLLSGASLVLPAVAAAGEPAPEAYDAAIPGLDEVLTADEQGFAGGLLTFDNASSPGNTIVRVTFEGDAAQNAYEVATLPGVVTDINSLLGLLGEGGYHNT